MSVEAGASKQTSWLALGAAALVGIQVGAATVASRYALPETDPVSLALMRYAIGAVSLLPFILAAPRPKFATRDLLPIGVLGIIQFAVLILMLNTGLTYIPAGRAALVFSAFPLLTLLFAALLGHETLTVRKAAGVLLTMLGVGVALGDRVAGSAAGGVLGEVLVFGAACCGAICSVLYRPYLQRYPALPVAGYAMLASVLFLAVLGTATGGITSPMAMSGKAQAAVIFIGLSSGLAFSILLWAYARATPTHVTMFQALAPLTATALGIAVLGESVTKTFLEGLACVIAGIVLALSIPRK